MNAITTVALTYVLAVYAYIDLLKLVTHVSTYSYYICLLDVKTGQCCSILAEGPPAS